jgi:hypothetical protein
MKDAAEMGSGVIKSASGIQKLIEEIKRHTDRKHGDRISTFLFFY